LKLTTATTASAPSSPTKPFLTLDEVEFP